MVFGLYSFTLNNDPSALLNRGISNINNHNYLEAISDLTMAISIQNDLGEAYYHRAICKDLFGKKEGFRNSDFCLDFIDALKYGYNPAIEKLYESGRGECFLLKSAIQTPEKVYCIDISSGKNIVLSNKFNKFHNLISLNAANNKINDLGTIFNTCPYIVSLDLGGNEISTIPNDISKLHFLYELNVSNNNIKNLPENISQLSNLTFLNLRGNQISELPKGIDSLKQLKLLDLSLNKLEKLPKSLFNMDHLETLVLAGNQISKKEIKKLQLSLPDTEIISGI